MTAIFTTIHTERRLPTRTPTRTIIELRGDLDIAAAPALREHLLDALSHSTNLLILDLSEVRFCDASGLAVLVGTQHRAQLLGVTLYLAAPRPQIAEVLRITGLDRGLPVYPTDAPRSFRTAGLRLVHAACCRSRYSSWTCCGLR